MSDKNSNGTDFKNSLQAFYEHRVKELNSKIAIDAEYIASKKKVEEEDLLSSRQTSYSQLYSQDEYKNAEETERYTLIGMPSKKKSIYNPVICLFPLPVPPVPPKKEKTLLEREADLKLEISRKAAEMI